MTIRWIAWFALAALGCARANTAEAPIDLGSNAGSAGLAGTVGAAGRTNVAGTAANAGAGGRAGSAGQSGAAGQTSDVCAMHQQAVQDFVSKHRACTAEADCAVVGTCSGGFGFEAVNLSAVVQAQGLSDSTPGGCVVSDGPMYRPVCQQGACALAATDGYCGAVGGANATICDGSTNIRLAFGIGGGFVPNSYQFTSPYGMRFALVDGRCSFYAMSDAMSGIAHGTLTGEQARALSSALHYPELDAWAGARPVQGADCGGIEISKPDAAVSCACGCGTDAPAGLSAAIAAVTKQIEVLVGLGTASSGPLTALALLDNFSTAAPVAWPLSRAMSSFPGLIGDPAMVTVDSGARFEAGPDSIALRTLRHDAFTRMSSVIRVQEGTAGAAYSLYMRDELPEGVAAARQAFLDKSRTP